MPDLKTIVFILAAAFSTFFFFETRYADSAFVEQVAMRLDQKILSDQLNAVQSRIWALEDRYRNTDMPQAVIEEYRALKERKRQLEEKLKKGG